MFFFSDLKTKTFKFKLTAEQSSNISRNINYLNDNIEYSCQLQMRIGHIQANSTEISDSLPIRYFIQTNGKINTPPEYDPQRSNPINITPLLKLDLNAMNEVAIHWELDGNTHVMGMYLVHRLNSKTLVNKLFAKKSKSAEDTLKFIIQKMSVFDPDVHTTTLFRFSVVCPLSKIRIKVPVNSVNCNHLQCFDAGTFILMNERTPTWKCPTCNIPCLYDDLQVNFYFLNVLANSYLTDSVEEIELLPNGTWRELGGRSMGSIENASEINQIPIANRPINNIIDVIDLTSQDMENDDNESAQYI